MIQVLELKGYNSYKAFTSFHKLMLGLKMLPMYMSEGYEEFFSRISKMSESDQEKMIREAAYLVTLEPEETEPLIMFCADKNGVPYSKENSKNLKPLDYFEIIVAVCKEFAKIKDDFLDNNEKKN